MPKQENEDEAIVLVDSQGRVYKSPPTTIDRFKSFSTQSWKILTAVSAFVAVIAVLLSNFESIKRFVGPTDSNSTALVDQLLKHNGQLILDNQALRESILDAVVSLPQQSDIPNANARIDAAEKALLLGNVSLAEAIYTEIGERKVSGDNHSRMEAAEAFRRLGALASLSGTHRSIVAYQRATELDPENSIGWNDLGHILIRAGRLSDAESAYKHFFNLAPDDSVMKAIAYGSLGHLYEARGELDEAFSVYQKSLLLYQKFGDNKGVAITYGNLGNVHNTRNELDQAVAMYQKSLSLNQQIGRKSGIATAYSNLGNVHKKRGELDQAINMYQKGLALYRELDHKIGLADININMGNVDERRGKLDAAAAKYQTSLTLNQEIGRKIGIALSYSNLGNVNELRGDSGKAIQQYQKSVELYIEFGRKDALAINYNNLGRAYQSLGELDKARVAWNQSLDLFEEMDSPSANLIRQLLYDLE